MMKFGNYGDSDIIMETVMTMIINNFQTNGEKNRLRYMYLEI